jgi:hypothetical protein
MRKMRVFQVQFIIMGFCFLGKPHNNRLQKLNIAKIPPVHGVVGNLGKIFGKK